MEESIIRLLVQTTLEEFFVSQHLILGYISMISVWKEKKNRDKKVYGQWVYISFLTGYLF